MRGAGSPTASGRRADGRAPLARAPSRGQALPGTPAVPDAFACAVIAANEKQSGVVAALAQSLEKPAARTGSLLGAIPAAARLRAAGLLRGSAFACPLVSLLLSRGAGDAAVLAHLPDTGEVTRRDICALTMPLGLEAERDGAAVELGAGILAATGASCGAAERAALVSGACKTERIALALVFLAAAV